MANYFDDHCYSASHVARGKPAPDLFLLAAEKLGVSPTRCALIEDSRYGVEGGRAGGMHVIGYAALTPVEVLHAAGAAHVAETMEAVSTLL